jgi:lipoyl-dependent peroxiredoxin
VQHDRHGCYNYALANIARQQGLSVGSITTTAQLTMGGDERGYFVDGIHLVVTATLPGVDVEEFDEIAEGARSGCAISKALRVPVTLDARLTT